MSESQRNGDEEDENRFLIDEQHNQDINDEVDGGGENFDDEDIDEHDEEECDSVENIDDDSQEEEEIQNNNNSNNNNTEVDIDIDYDDDNDVNDDDNDDDNNSIENHPREYCYLHQAIKNNELMNTIMEIIKLYPMDAQYEDIYENYPLHKACHDGHHDVAMILIELFPDAAHHKNSKGLYPLHLAIICDSSNAVLVMKLIDIFPEAVKAFIECTMFGMVGTALHFACKNKLSETIITKLIEIHPVARQLQDAQGRYPIDIAIRSGQPVSVIKLLLDGDPFGLQQRTEDNDKLPTFHYACQTNNYDLVKFLMQRSDLHINVRDINGWTPLHYACWCNKDKSIDDLLHHPDVDVNATNCWNDTPLHATLQSIGNQEACHNIVQKLLNHPCIYINQQNKNDKTALDLIKAHLIELEMRNDRFGTQEIELQEAMKIINLLEEFPVKRKWQSYCFHVINFIDL